MCFCSLTVCLHTRVMKTRKLWKLLLVLHDSQYWFRHVHLSPDVRPWNSGGDVIASYPGKKVLSTSGWPFPCVWRRQEKMVVSWLSFVCCHLVIYFDEPPSWGQGLSSCKASSHLRVRYFTLTVTGNTFWKVDDGSRSTFYLSCSGSFSSAPRGLSFIPWYDISLSYFYLSLCISSPAWNVSASAYPIFRLIRHVQINLLNTWDAMLCCSVFLALPQLNATCALREVWWKDVRVESLIQNFH